MTSDWLFAFVCVLAGTVSSFILAAQMAAGGNANEQDRKDDKDGGSGAGGATGPVENAHSAEGGAFEGTAPDYTGYLTGWRAWKVTREGRLSAVTHDGVWPVKEALHAVCKNEDAKHISPRAPHPDCTCGIYAYKTREDALAEWRGNSDCAALGEVALWGRVVLAERGYRAEFAYPLRLLVSANLPVLPARQLEDYGVPVEILPEDPLSAMAPNRGTQVPIPAPMVSPTASSGTVNPRWALGLTHGFSFSMQQPSMVYAVQLPLGMFYRAIELCKEAQGYVREVELIMNGAIPVCHAPLSMLGRSSGGNFMIYDGLRDGTAIDTRKLARLDLRLYFESTFPATIPPPQQLTVGYLHHV